MEMTDILILITGPVSAIFFSIYVYAIAKRGKSPKAGWWALGTVLLWQIFGTWGAIRFRSKILLTISILAIITQIAAIAMIGQQAKEEVLQNSTASNIAKIMRASKMYAESHDGRIPHSFEDIKPYLETERTLRDLRTPNDPQVGYVLLMSTAEESQTSLRFDDIEKAVPFVRDRDPWQHDNVEKVWVGLSDGNVVRMLLSDM